MAEVRGVDLRQRLDRATAEELYDAFLEYGVLVLPGQALTIDQHLDFARLFGDLWELPVWNDLSRIKNRAIDDVSNLDLNGDLAGTDSEKVFFLSGNKRWHSDLSNNSVAAKASLLHALEIALDGGETEFADPRAGYEALSGELKDRLEGLIGQFSFAYSTAKTNLDAEKLRELVPPSQHPIVRVHPETGRKNLFIGANLERVLSLSDGESAALIEELATFTAQERFVYRHRWAVHDLIVGTTGARCIALQTMTWTAIAALCIGPRCVTKGRTWLTARSSCQKSGAADRVWRMLTERKKQRSPGHRSSRASRQRYSAAIPKIWSNATGVCASIRSLSHCRQAAFWIHLSNLWPCEISELPDRPSPLPVPARARRWRSSPRAPHSLAM